MAVVLKHFAIDSLYVASYSANLKYPNCCGSTAVACIL